LLDVLSIVEHPAFQSFYDDLINEGLAGITGDELDDTSATGDVLAAELRDGYEAFDFGIPFILQETDELRDHHAIDVLNLPAFTAMPISKLTELLGQGDTFISQDLQSATLFGDYRVDGAVMNVSGYNDYLSRLTRRISQALSSDLPKGNKVAAHLAKPYLQVNTAELTGWIDDYIWTQLFGGAFNPLEGENWRVLLLQPAVDHITKVFAVALLDAEQKHVTGQTEVHQRMLSEVSKLMMRECSSVEISKCIYTRLGWPARNGGLEKKLIHWAQADTQVQAFCKISENRHTFARLRYVKDDGLPAFYSPDFLVRTHGVANEAIYLVETKAQQQTIHPNVQRKLKAALAWCDRINALPASMRGGFIWQYVLLGEAVVDEWQAKNARLADLLDFARLRPLADVTQQQKLL
jgi:type III restriction enzyme